MSMENRVRIAVRRSRMRGPDRAGTAQALKACSKIYGLAEVLNAAPAWWLR